jgi:hypothetical protein
MLSRKSGYVVDWMLARCSLNLVLPNNGSQHFLAWLVVYPYLVRALAADISA